MLDYEEWEEENYEELRIRYYETQACADTCMEEFFDLEYAAYCRYEKEKRDGNLQL